MKNSLSVRTGLWTNVLFVLLLLYIASPWFFERKLLFNEILSLCGMGTLVYYRSQISRDPVSRYVFAFLLLCLAHMITSIWRADNVYVYLRNLVIAYSPFCFFLGFYFFDAYRAFMQKYWRPICTYLAVGLAIPVGTLPFQNFFYERFGLSVLFPNLVERLPRKYLYVGMIGLMLVYSLTYKSATAVIIAAFFALIWVCKNYNVLKWLAVAGLAGFAAFFAYVLPNLNLINNRYHPYNDDGIMDVRNSMKILAVDPNSTWRLVLWKEVLVDHFPENIPGMGFGTRVMEVFPVEDEHKVPILPYVLGAHNSYIYLFGRLGLLYILMTAFLYRYVIKEYYKHREYYHGSGNFKFLWGFFAISLIAVFNPTLESSIFSGSYWFFLGLTGAAIIERKKTQTAATA